MSLLVPSNISGTGIRTKGNLIRMTTLDSVRRTAAELQAQGMPKPERVAYLRRNGWRSTKTSGVGSWVKSGLSLTTRRATEQQLLEDMEAGVDTLGG